MAKIHDSNTDQYKSRIREYLEKSGVAIDDKKKPPVFRCVDPNHTDKKPSCVLYPEQAYCPVCGFKDDIFGVAGAIHNLSDFKDQLNNVKEVLVHEIAKPKTKINKKNAKLFPVPLPTEKARGIYNHETLQKIADFMKVGELKNAWPYTDKNDDIIAVDVRFEKDNEKQVITFWYDGKNVVTKNRPNLIYNLYEVINENKKIIIHEGSKCAGLGKEKLPDFVHSSWNGGSNNANKIEWKIFNDRDVFILRDNDDPGLKAANEIKLQLPNAIIIHPPENLSEHGDIEQYLEMMTADKLTEYILSHEKKNDNTTPPPPDIPENGDKETGFPFKILGMADDGMGYFLTRNERLFSTPMEHLTQGKFLILANWGFWKKDYAIKGKVDWNQAQCDLIEITGERDFDPDAARGRGAWKDGDNFVFNLGNKIIGNYSDKYLYLKKRPKDFGLSEKPAGKELRIEIADVIRNLNFATMRDSMLYMGWTVLSPFAGALPWRPALLVTGPSESGKSTLADYVSIPISMSENWNGGETTPAFLRQYYGNDSCAINLDESERDTKEKRKNVEANFSVMRQSTSDNAPKTGKGSANGKPISYSMKNMFMFDAISPEIEALADENRIFRINIVPPTNNWKEVKKDLVRLLNKKNCKSIRALTWIKLKDILEGAKNLTEIVQVVSGKSTRRSYAEALLFSAYLIVWYGYDEIDYKFAETILREYYGKVEKEKEINASDELLQRLLDEVVILSNSKNRYTLRECLMESYQNDEENNEYKTTLGQHGLSLTNTDELAIASNHHEIKRILNLGKGYNQILWRHPNLSKKNGKYRTVRINGTSRSCAIICDVLEKKYDTPEDVVDEEIKNLFEE